MLSMTMKMTENQIFKSNLFVSGAVAGTRTTSGTTEP